MAILFKVGSRYETDREAGVSHFLEHMFFKGSARYGGAKEIAEAIEGVGGVLNAATDKELTMYWARVPRTKVGLAIDVLGDMLFAPLLDPVELEKERLVVLEELRMYQDSPQEYVHSLFEQISWPNHPLGRDVGGTEASVRALTREDLLRYLEEHYLLRNLVVTIAGPITHDGAIALVEPYLKPRGNGTGPPGFLPSTANGLKPGVLLKSKKTEQAHICLGVHAPSYMDRDRHTIDILNCVLGEGMSSRLFLEVREKLGLAYDVHSYVNKMFDTGVLGVYAGTEPRQAARAVGAIVGQLRRLCNETVEAQELTKAKEFYKGRLLLQMESTNSVATWYGGQEALMGRIQDVDETVAEIDAVSAGDVMRIAQELFGQALQLAVIGPFRSEAPFLKQIA
jgi:predicted Zn-dependent peptidase